MSRFARAHPELNGSRLTAAMINQTRAALPKSEMPTQYCPKCHQPVFVLPAGARVDGPCLICIQQADER